MKIEWFRSATIGIYSNTGTSILCDPWMTDGAFLGSWHHWPPLEGFEFDEIVHRHWDAIYISHFHADHFDRKLLAKILKQHPQTPVLIPNYANKWLLRAITNLTLSPGQVFEVDDNRKIQVKDIAIQILKADVCNPKICGSSIPCQQNSNRQTANDSLAIFEADNQRILNANDALAVHSVNRIWPSIGKVNLFLGHFGGAGPFPQCFRGLSDLEKLEKADKTAQLFVNRLVQAAIRTDATFLMPYAGQYRLSGRLNGLNKFRSVMEMKAVLETIEKSSDSISGLALAPFGKFDLSTGEISKEWIAPSELDERNYDNKIKKVVFSYENEESWDDGQSHLEKALTEAKREFDRSLSTGNQGSNSSITLKSWTNEYQATINFGATYCDVSPKEIHFENHTLINVHPTLLKRIIMRKAGYKGFTQYHFNQAEIGSHLEWERVGLYPPETKYLNFAHSYH